MAFLSEIEYMNIIGVLEFESYGVRNNVKK
jgi:hypothetical protein